MSFTPCRSCGTPLEHTFCNLGLSPISNSFVRLENKNKPEVFHPLCARVCHKCWLVQLEGGLESEHHFHGDYAYFSSFSEGWLRHAKTYVSMMIERFDLNSESHVIEIASNDGYLLQYFVERKISCLGIEPTANTAEAARKKGVDTQESFFGVETAQKIRSESIQADLLLGNNVLAHVPDINDFVSGMPLVLKPEGVITLEFPHLLEQIKYNQFDTIYHEHYSYLSLQALIPIFERASLQIFDVERLPTHGGSLRVFVCHTSSKHKLMPAVQSCLQEEINMGLQNLATYENFAEKVNKTKRELLSFLIKAKKDGKTIAAYGAAAKGNTLLNYCGISTDFIGCVADKNPVKQGCLLPGSHIPVVAPEFIESMKPDYLLVLPWNIKNEVIKQMSVIRTWGGKFVVPIPTVEVIE